MTEEMKIKRDDRLVEFKRVFEAIANGKSEKQIISECFIGAGTYQRLVQAAKTKYKSATAAQLIANMIREGFIQ